MRSLFAALLSATILVPFSARAVAADDVKPAGDKPHIDIVFCIDRSKSMSPVIETAKKKVWAIVNEVARAKPSPVLRIGLVGYGEGEQLLHKFDLADDLDEVYKQLNTYSDDARTGQEFVGHAVHVATTQMKWSEGKQVLKIIYVVGNETARQGPAELDYTKTAPAAIAKGIIVNAIYCGDFDKNTAPPTWMEMAKLADGQYMEIAGSGGAVIVATPFDKDLADLSARLNTTYVAYGAFGASGAANQAVQDGNAGQLGGGVAADRAVSKSTRQYDNGRWDLVDASKRADFKLEEVKEDQLPEELRKMTPDQRKAHVEAKSKERDQIQAQIKEIAAKRDAYVKVETEKQGLKGEDAFDTAVRDSLTKQAEGKGYTFK